MLLAIIREAECIGCAKCIEACPVDAILGSNKQMHTVIADECIGCKLCLPPCPVDCIDLIALPTQEKSAETRKQKTQHVKNRYHARKQRLARNNDEHSENKIIVDRKAYIQAAVLRVKSKRN